MLIGLVGAIRFGPFFFKTYFTREHMTERGQLSVRTDVLHIMRMRWMRVSIWKMSEVEEGVGGVRGHLERSLCTYAIRITPAWRFGGCGSIMTLQLPVHNANIKPIQVRIGKLQ